MTISSLKLRNFQRHKKLDISLDPSITTFIGPSDAGKSAVIRALELVALNRPSGVEYITHGQKKATVEIKVDKRRVSRRRSKGTNAYSLDNKAYKAFSSKVPEAISELLNVTDLNFQRQHDPSFWFHLSPGQLSKELNRIVSLTAIDTALDLAAKKVRAAKADRDAAVTRLDEAKEAKKELAWVVEADRVLTQIEAKQKRLKRLKKQASVLASLLESVQTASERRKVLRTCARRAGVVVSKASRLLQLTEQIKSLSSLLSEHKEYTKWSQVEVPSLDKLKQLDELCHQIDYLHTLIQNHQEQEKELCRLRKQAKRLDAKLQSIPTCPTCGQILRK